MEVRGLLTAVAYLVVGASPGALLGKNPGCQHKGHKRLGETWVPPLGREDPLEEDTATHSSALAWRIPWTEEPGGLQSLGSQRRTRLSDLARVHTSGCGAQALGRLQQLPGTGSAVAAQRFGCSMTCGIFLDQGLNPCPCAGRWSPRTAPPGKSPESLLRV